MKHHKMEDLGAVAEVVPFSVTKMSRKERLQRELKRLRGETPIPNDNQLAELNSLARRIEMLK